MANENYENVNDKMQGQPDENPQKSIKTHDMLEALEKSMEVARGTLTEAFKDIRKEHPQYDIGSALRRFHLSLLETIKRTRFLTVSNIKTPVPRHRHSRVKYWVTSPRLMHTLLTTRPQLVHYLPLINKLLTANQCQMLIQW